MDVSLLLTSLFYAIAIDSALILIASEKLNRFVPDAN